MIKAKSRIKKSKLIFDSIALTCKMIDSNDYSWSNLLTTTSFPPSSTCPHSSSTKTSILVWSSILTKLFTSSHENAFWPSKRKTSSILWRTFWSWCKTIFSNSSKPWRLKSTSIENWLNTILKIKSNCSTTTSSPYDRSKSSRTKCWNSSK